MADRAPDILVVAVDTLRPSHLGCYGYSRPTSPAIDRLAEQSLVFDRAFAAGIPTTPSFTTLLSGLHPYRHGVVTHPGHHLDEDIRLLPQLAREAGYVTAACDNMVVQGGGRGTWFARGYDHYSGFLYTPFGAQSADITDRALGLTARAGDKPMLTFLHYWDPHTPYGPRPPYDTMHYEPGSGPVDLADVYAVHPEYYEAFLADMHLAHPDDYAYVMAQYDGEISQVDAQIGRLVEGLRAQGRWDNTVVLLLSDHGECFGEGGLYFDHHGLYDAVTRVTMMLRLPGQPGGRTGALVSNEDVLPTLCELGGFPLPEYPLTGRTLGPILDGRAADSAAIRERVISVESSRQASLALRTATEKLIQPVTEDVGGKPLPDLYGRARSPEPLLFDLADDPAESRDLAAERPDRVAALRADLEQWRAAELARSGDPDPIRAGALSLPYERFMRRRFERLQRAKEQARS